MEVILLRSVKLRGKHGKHIIVEWQHLVPFLGPIGETLIGSNHPRVFSKKRPIAFRPNAHQAKLGTSKVLRGSAGRVGERHVAFAGHRA